MTTKEKTLMNQQNKVYPAFFIHQLQTLQHQNFKICRLKWLAKVWFWQQTLYYLYFIFNLFIMIIDDVTENFRDLDSTSLRKCDEHTYKYRYLPLLKRNNTKITWQESPVFQSFFTSWNFNALRKQNSNISLLKIVHLPGSVQRTLRA